MSDTTPIVDHRAVAPPAVARRCGGDVDASMRASLVRLCYVATPLAQLVTVINGALLFYFLHDAVPSPAMSWWLAILGVVAALRLGSYSAFENCPDLFRAVARFERLGIAGAALSGALWGLAAILLFVDDSVAHQAILSFVVAGMVAGGVTTLSSLRAAAGIFIVLATLPLAWRFAVADHVFAHGMALLVVLFAAMMIVASRRFAANYRDSLAAGLRREAAERELAQIAYFDPLTDLPNRRLFSEYLERAVSAARRQKGYVAVCHVDLDNFKHLNERHGHDVGDRLLILAANTFKQSIRAGDVVARWGGDEFALLLTGFHAPNACTVALRRLTEALAQPFELDGETYTLSASIGVSIAPGESDDPETLLRQAGQAMYQAKQAGRNRFHVFESGQDDEDQRRREARDSLERALANEELVLFVQPKVEMDCGRVYGAEALLRWQHPERGLLAPGAFLDAWEADPAMAQLDRWVVENAVDRIEGWRARGHDLVLSVNVSAWLLHEEGFVDYVDRLLDTHPSVRGYLELEVTETRALDDIGRVSDVMHACLSRQVEFALDDFGTGFSSLVHLQRLPAHALKIDASFVRGMLDNEHDRNLVRGIVGLGEAIGKQVVAEGVETEAHGLALLRMGCRHAQGYGIARPMPASDLAEWIAHYRAPPSWRQASPLPTVQVVHA
ncbi:MAG: EAL domain-containing protein [Gammaproteobacteria bacterium]|nr:EAL domain-containing protein [Gammaproteobacteria bacterium]MCP5198873.1 EAL domain-containing protein [Gammaproteobacteria bacterium]